jgi:hypothetical protein
LDLGIRAFNIWTSTPTRKYAPRPPAYTIGRGWLVGPDPSDRRCLGDCNPTFEPQLQLENTPLSADRPCVVGGVRVQVMSPDPRWGGSGWRFRRSGDQGIQYLNLDNPTSEPLLQLGNTHRAHQHGPSSLVASDSDRRWWGAGTSRYRGTSLISSTPLKDNV